MATAAECHAAGTEVRVRRRRPFNSGRGLGSTATSSSYTGFRSRRAGSSHGRHRLACSRRAAYLSCRALRSFAVPWASLCRTCPTPEGNQRRSGSRPPGVSYVVPTTRSTANRSMSSASRRRPQTVRRPPPPCRWSKILEPSRRATGVSRCSYARGSRSSYESVGLPSMSDGRTGLSAMPKDRE